MKTNYTCINRTKHNNKIINYTIIDNTTNQIFEVTPEELKSKMSSGEVSIANLKLTSDNRLVLSKEDFQEKVEDTAKKYGTSTQMTKLEEQTDLFIKRMLEQACIDKVMQVQKLDTTGNINTIILRLNPTYTNTTDNLDLVFRYRKNISGKDLHNCRSNLVLRLISVERNDIPFKIKETYDFNRHLLIVDKSVIKLKADESKMANDFVNYVAKVLKTNCLVNKNINNKELQSSIEEALAKFKKAGLKIAAAAVITTCVVTMTGCGKQVDAQADTVAVETQMNQRTYQCDYKTLSILRTKITFEIDGEQVTVQGNILKFITDPLKMLNAEGKTIAYADDSFHLISEDDHSIIVDGAVECIMEGDINLIGKSYKIYNAEGEHIANFDRNLITSWGARITDLSGNTIAEYSRGILRNDFEVTIYDNDDVELSDKAIMMMMSSFVSDQKYQDSSSSSTNSKSS